MKLKTFYKKHSKKLLVFLILATIAQLIISLFYGNLLPEELRENLPWLIGGTILSEVMFVLGIGIMAYAVGHDVGLNPFKWRKHVKQVIHKVTSDRLFWTGFWVNFIGAFGTGSLWFAAIIFGLPVESWGILWLPILDIVLTLSLRGTVLELKREKAL